MKKENVLTTVFFITGIAVELFTPELKNRIMRINFWDTIAILLLITAIISFMLSKINELKNKIKSLKAYKDEEIIFLLNRFNANIEILENKVTYLNNKIAAYNDVEIIDPTSHIGRAESENQFEKKLKDYNEAFKDWGCDELGKGHLSIIQL